jgi:hypothetical protein
LSYSGNCYILYIKTIIKLSSNGLLSYIISNTDISYGTNFKIEYIIIDNTCFEDNNHSIYTLFQLISRAGRRGISWKASIYCDYLVIDLIKKFSIINEHTIEDLKFKKIIQKLIKEFNVTLIDKVNDTLFDVLNEDPLINIDKNNETINSTIKNDYLQKIHGGAYINNPTLPNKTIN